jgi:hypothetical protein
MAAIAHRQSYFAGKLEPAHAKRQAMVIHGGRSKSREPLLESQNPITSERPRASVAEIYLSAVSDNGPCRAG